MPALVRVIRSTLNPPPPQAWLEETAFYASSIMLPAQIFAGAIRGHWAVENENHWVRDVTLAEDASLIRVNPSVIAHLRSQALNIARAHGVENIAQALWSGASIQPSQSHTAACKER